MLFSWTHIFIKFIKGICAVLLAQSRNWVSSILLFLKYNGRQDPSNVPYHRLWSISAVQAPRARRIGGTCGSRVGVPFPVGQQCKYFSTSSRTKGDTSRSQGNLAIQYSVLLWATRNALRTGHLFDGVDGLSTRLCNRLKEAWDVTESYIYMIDLDFSADVDLYKRTPAGFEKPKACP